VFFVRTLIFGVVDERAVETGLKPVSTHFINYSSPKSVTMTHHESNTPGLARRLKAGEEPGPDGLVTKR